MNPSMMQNCLVKAMNDAAMRAALVTFRGKMPTQVHEVKPGPIPSPKQATAVKIDPAKPGGKTTRMKP